jgi:hypothetical protein
MQKQTFDINEIRKSQIDEFSQFMNKLTSIEDSVLRKIAELDKSTADLNILLKSLQEEKDEVGKSKSIIQAKLDEANGILSQAKSQQKAIDDKNLLLDEKEKRINLKKDGMLKEATSIQSMEDDLKKRTKWIEIEERHLKLLDHKIKVIMEDKEVSKRLKELGE